MSLLAKALERREEHDDQSDSYQRMWDAREQQEACRRASFLLEHELGEETFTKVAGDRERTCWEFSFEGYEFLAGSYWCHVPGPAGNAFFLAVRTGRPARKIEWPPPDEHGGDWTVKGYARIRFLADLADIFDGEPAG